MNTLSNTSQDANEKKPHPFEYLKPQSDKILENWNIARAYVLDLLKKKMAGKIPQCWHFEINGDNDLMLAVVRHLAFYAHFINYEEYNSLGELTCNNRTIISIVSHKSAAEIVTELEQKHNLCNLPKYCKLSVFGNTRNENSYIDIEIEIVKGGIKGDNIISISEKCVQEFVTNHSNEEIFHIDTHKAFYASKIYDLGDYIGTIPYEDINCAERYSKALDAFQYKILECGKNTDLINHDEWRSSLLKAKTGLSNIFCADCFEIREQEIKHIVEAIKEKDKEKNEDETKVWQKIKSGLGKKRDEKLYAETWKNRIRELSDCEHRRWVAEKLILGYGPLSKEELFTSLHLSGKKRSDYLKGLKNNEETPKHIDLCSNLDLRRTDPDNMKFDSFLMLAIPLILKRIREEDRRISVEK